MLAYLRRKKLCRLLTIAAKKLAAIHGPIWSRYNSGEDMAKFVLKCRDAINQGTITLDQKEELWIIFLPTSDWDDVGGDMQLGNEIDFLLNKLYRKEILVDTAEEPHSMLDRHWILRFMLIAAIVAGALLSWSLGGKHSWMSPRIRHDSTKHEEARN
jgi:hypothetical protein